LGSIKEKVINTGPVKNIINDFSQGFMEEEK